MKNIDIYKKNWYCCTKSYFNQCVKNFGIDGTIEFLKKYKKTEEQHYFEFIEKIKKSKWKRMSKAILSQMVSVLYGHEIGTIKISSIIDRMTKENVVSTTHWHYRIE